MASVLPKFYLYMFFSIISIIVNIGYTLTNMVTTNTFNLLALLSGFGTGFAPFSSLLLLAFTFEGMPIEVIAGVGVLTTVISVVQAYLIIEIIANHVPTVNV